MTCAVQLCELC